MLIPIYIAAPFADAALVREVGARLPAFGAESRSTWAECADGPEQLEAMTPDEVRSVAAANDRDLLASFALVVLSRDGAGGEMFAEARLALEYGIPIVWVGKRRPLSAYREGVIRVDTIEDALDLVRRFSECVRQPFPVDDEWARDTLWSYVEIFAASKEAA